MFSVSSVVKKKSPELVFLPQVSFLFSEEQAFLPVVWGRALLLSAQVPVLGLPLGEEGPSFLQTNSGLHRAQSTKIKQVVCVFL